jgi:hypothetical protein
MIGESRNERVSVVKLSWFSLLDMVLFCLHPSLISEFCTQEVMIDSIRDGCVSPVRRAYDIPCWTSHYTDTYPLAILVNKQLPP